MRKIFLIPASVASIELLLRRNPFIVRLTDLQASVTPKVAGKFKLLKPHKPFKPLKLLYG